jgi:hypothetical protein
MHDDRGFWEMNGEKVGTKLTRKQNNVTEAVDQKMTGMWMHKSSHPKTTPLTL